MALDFRTRAGRDIPDHTIPIGERSFFAIEKVAEDRYRIRTMDATSTDVTTGVIRGWGAELTHAQAVNITRAMAQLCVLLAEVEGADE